MALCAAPELGPHYGRLYAYLHDDVTRKLASPQADRAAARRLGCLERAGPRLLRPCVAAAPHRRRAPAREREPAARSRTGCSRSPTGSRRTCSEAGSTTRRATAGCDACRCPRSIRAAPAAIEELRPLLAAQSRLPLLVAGPDAETILAAALDRPLLLVDVSDAADAELLRDARRHRAARGAAALLRRPRRPRAGQARAGAAAAGGARRADTRLRRLAPGGRRARRVDGRRRRGAAAELRRAANGVGRDHRDRRGRRRRGEVPALGRPDRRGRRGRAGSPLPRAARPCRSRPTSTSARAAPRARGSPSSPRGSTRRSAGTTS